MAGNKINKTPQFTGLMTQTELIWKGVTAKQIDEQSSAVDTHMGNMQSIYLCRELTWTHIGL
jgi:hypothetical protein